jgi:hypothetical protein
MGELAVPRQSPDAVASGWNPDTGNPQSHSILEGIKIFGSGITGPNSPAEDIFLLTWPRYTNARYIEVHYGHSELRRR